MGFETKKKVRGPGLGLLGLGLSVLSGLMVMTQSFAHQMHYHPSLGTRLGPLYLPWEFLSWKSAWFASSSLTGVTLTSMGLGVVTALAFGTLTLVVWRLLSRRAQASLDLHGSARWASPKDIHDAGLMNDEGVFVGAVMHRGKRTYLRHNGPEHVLTFAPTRSGKGVGLVIPTLVTWEHSAVITDLKGELWALSSGVRQSLLKNKVLYFEPASKEKCVKWNPLEEIRIGKSEEVGDAQNIATLIVDPDGQGLKDHWQKTAQALLTGCILHLLYRRRDTRRKDMTKPAHMGALVQMLSDPGKPVKELWEEMANNTWLKSNQPHALIASAGQDMIDRPDNEAGSVLSTAKSYLSLYRDPVVCDNTSQSEFRIKDLMHHDSPVSLWIVTQPADKARLTPLLRILVNMIVRILADGMTFEHGRPKANYQHRLLMMLDEFPSLGKLDIMQESLAFVAGYGIKCYLIIQDLAQLQKAYGKDESITSNCHIHNAYPPGKLQTAEHLSRLTGQTTVVKENITQSGARMGLILGQVSQSYQEVQRPLLTVDECLRLPGPKKNPSGDIVEAGDMLIYVAGFPAIYGKQPLYFQDAKLLKRAQVPPPEHSDTLKKTTEELRRERVKELELCPRKRFLLLRSQVQAKVARAKHGAWQRLRAPRQ